MSATTPKQQFEDKLIEISELKREVAQLKWDIDAYRGALGYSIPGSHTGKLTDGTTPQCGMCNSEHRKNLEAESAEARGNVEKALRELAEEVHKRQKAEAKCAEMRLSFAYLREANVQRCEAVFHKLAEWSPTDWACAMAGEAGETCNAVKKLRRMDHGTNTQKDPKTYEDHVGAIAKEIADTVIYADLLAARLGIRLDDAIHEKFNEVSDRMNCQIKLSSDCGKDYVSRAVVAQLVETLEKVRKCDLEHFQYQSCGCERSIIKALAAAKSLEVL